MEKVIAKKTNPTNSPGSSYGKNRPRRGSRGNSFDKPRQEFDQKMIDVRRVTRVVTGGRRMSFAVTMIIGDRKGAVGVGTGKAIDTALAITKAVKSARKNMISIKTTKSMSIPYDISAKFCASHVSLVPNHGRGLVAGSAVRDVLNLAGLHDISAKINSGSKNKLNNARAAIAALNQISSPYRGKVEVIPVIVEPVDGAVPKILESDK